MKCKSILLVEDNDDIRDSLEDVLRTEGYKVYGVANGREALRALKAIEGPCLILLDMMMPLMNGWEFLEAQRMDAKIANLPIVVLSALDAQAALVKQSNLVPAEGFMRKPLDLGKLIDIVQFYCGDREEDEESIAEPLPSNARKAAPELPAAS